MILHAVLCIERASTNNSVPLTKLRILKNSEQGVMSHLDSFFFWNCLQRGLFFIWLTCALLTVCDFFIHWLEWRLNKIHRLCTLIIYITSWNYTVNPIAMFSNGTTIGLEFKSFCYTYIDIIRPSYDFRQVCLISLTTCVRLKTVTRLIVVSTVLNGLRIQASCICLITL